MKISSWNFQHLFITSLCQIDKKILVPTQSACQPRPISAKTLNVSSDHICWDILKRKKLGGFQTISNDWLEGIFDILKKTAFWNFLIELWVHPNAVHALCKGFHYFTKASVKVIISPLSGNALYISVDYVKIKIKGV